jgi:hypothetical protein
MPIDLRDKALAPFAFAPPREAQIDVARPSASRISPEPKKEIAVLASAAQGQDPFPHGAAPFAADARARVDSAL